VKTADSYPTLLIYGDADERMPAETAAEVFEALPGPGKHLLFFPGAGHGAAWRSDPACYIEAVLAFMDGNTPQCASTEPQAGPTG
jgi:pimeloyl-ACP methyl ester carboxylesterase